MENLYPFIGHRIGTMVGAGWLWQVFRDRFGVVLDVKPERVVFLTDAGGVHPLPDNREIAPWNRNKTRKKALPWRQEATFFGLEGEGD